MKQNLFEELKTMQYLFDYQRGVVISEQVVQGPKGDPYQYKRENGKFYYAYKKSGQNPTWVEAKNKKSIDAINTKIFANVPQQSQQQVQQSQPEWYTATMTTAQDVYDYLANDPTKMSGKTFNTFGYFKMGGKGLSRVNGVATNLTKEQLIQKAKSSKAKQNFESYTFPQAPQGGFVPNYIGNFEQKTTEIQTQKPAEQSEWCKSNTSEGQTCLTDTGSDYETIRAKVHDQGIGKGLRKFKEVGYQEFQNNGKIYSATFGK